MGPTNDDESDVVEDQDVGNDSSYDGSSAASNESDDDEDDDFRARLAAIAGLLDSSENGEGENNDGEDDDDNDDAAAAAGENDDNDDDDEQPPPNDDSYNSDDSDDIDDAKLAAIAGILGGDSGALMIEEPVHQPTPIEPVKKPDVAVSKEACIDDRVPVHQVPAFEIATQPDLATRDRSVETARKEEESLLACKDESTQQNPTFNGTEEESSPQGDDIPAEPESEPLAPVPSNQKFAPTSEPNTTPEQDEQSSSEEEDDDADSDSDSDDDGKGATVKIKEAPLLRLENVTSMTRSKIPVESMQKKQGGMWGSLFSTVNKIAMDAQVMTGVVTKATDESKHGGKEALPGTGPQVSPSPQTSLSSGSIPILGDPSGAVTSTQNKDVDKNVAVGAPGTVSSGGDVTYDASESTRSATTPAAVPGTVAPTGSIPAQPASETPFTSFTENKKPKKEKKVKKKENDLFSHFKKNTRKVNKHGDDVSVGTSNLKDSGETEPFTVSTLEHEQSFAPIEREARPWETERKVRKEWNMPKAPRVIDKAVVEDEEDEEGESDGGDMVSLGGGSAVDQVSVGEPSPGAEEEVEAADVLESLNALENALKEHEAESGDSFDEMWDNADADVTTAIELERKQRQNFRRKKERREQKKSKKYGDDYEETKKFDMKRIYLFESEKKRSSKKRSSKKDKDDKISSEFLSAIRKVFDDESEEEQDLNASFASAGSAAPGGSGDEMEDDASEKSEGSHEQGSGKKSSRTSFSDSEEESVYGDGDVSLGTSRSGSRDSVSRSDDGRSKRSKSSRMTSRSKVSSSSKRASKRSGKSKRAKLNPAAMLDSEMKRQQVAKVMSVSSLRQEMLDRKGTSTLLLRKEFEAKKREREAEAAGWNKPVVSKGGDADGLLNLQFSADFGDSAAPRESKKSKEKKTSQLDDLAENKEVPTSQGLSGHLSRWDRPTVGSDDLDDLETVHQEPEPYGGVLTGALSAGGMSTFDTSELGSGEDKEPSGGFGGFSFKETGSSSLAMNPLIGGEEKNPGGGFADFPLSAISEDEDDDENRLLSRERDFDDERSVRSEKSERFSTKIKVPKIGFGGVKKFMAIRKKQQDSLSSDGGWREEDDGYGDNSTLLE